MRNHFEFSSVVKEELLFKSLYYSSPCSCFVLLFCFCFVKRSKAICANLVNKIIDNSCVN